MKITSLFSKNKTHFSLTNTHIFLLFLCKIPLFYTVSLSLITVYNFWICFMHLKQLGGGTILIIIWLIPLFWLLVILNTAWDLLSNSLCHSLQYGLYSDPLGCHPWGQSLLGQATWSLDACQLEGFCQPGGNCTICHCICFKSLDWSTSHSSNGIWWTCTSWQPPLIRRGGGGS